MKRTKLDKPLYLKIVAVSVVLILAIVAGLVLLNYCTIVGLLKDNQKFTAYGKISFTKWVL